MTKPVLVFGYGNLSRGDDALGVLVLEHIKAHHSLDHISLLTDFQLQIEHALDLENRDLVMFVDASVAGECAFDFCRLRPIRDMSHTMHAMSPSAVLDVYQTMYKKTPPPCFLMSIKADRFELGDALSPKAQHNLQMASLFIDVLLKQPSLDAWQSKVTL